MLPALLVFRLTGEVLVLLTALPVPGPVIGMLQQFSLLLASARSW